MPKIQKKNPKKKIITNSIMFINKKSLLYIYYIFIYNFFYSTNYI